jgi:hypothetical protein
VFQTKVFRKWANKEKLGKEERLDAVKEIEKGLIDASLGGSLFKKEWREQEKESLANSGRF